MSNEISVTLETKSESILGMTLPLVLQISEVLFFIKNKCNWVNKKYPKKIQLCAQISIIYTQSCGKTYIGKIQLVAVK